ncbi:hypothetical protein ACJ5H2_13370 [Nocardioides sp. R1-1]|uniref:hypothetical protein n=1 Tax=Nocardioides sp. R1-1 TaxID=3383502 RepID=UPI0038D14DBA
MTVIHRVPFGSTTLTAICGTDLGRPGVIGVWGSNPTPSTGESWCRDCYCYPRHRATISRVDQRLRDMSAPLLPARHRAEVSA